MQYEKKYHPLQERIVDVITTKTQTNNRHFFRILTLYQFGKLAAMMKTTVRTKDRGDIPVNIYALNLMTSGAGKGYSMNIFEENFLAGFRKNFFNNILPAVEAKNISRIAANRAARDSCDPQDWIDKLEAESQQLGPMIFAFDSATTPAIKQLRQKLLLSGIGSMNLEIDEISSNFTTNMDVLITLLELYDKGLVKQKLTKNTRDNLRTEELPGKTPTNLMMFGTPVKLLDGSKTEDAFKQMLEIGYARRLLVGYSTKLEQNIPDDVEEYFRLLTNPANNQSADAIRGIITALADMGHFKQFLTVTDEVTMQYLQYKLDCEAKAIELPEHEETAKAEMAHRYFKVIKAAGAYAFMDASPKVTSEHIDYAITMVEDSGAQFVELLKKEGPYVKLARFIANVGRDVTHVDLIENLPFYKGTKADKTELLDHACAYGYQNNLIIKRWMVNNIEFLSGEALQETDLNEIQVSFSKDITLNFLTTKVPFKDLHKLVCAEGFHYCSHGFKEGYRHSDKVIPGFNLLILDVDHGLQLQTVMDLLAPYAALYATTKRHTDDAHRFRIILPMSHFLKLTAEDHVQFMENFFNWLPFKVDTAPKDIARKWMSHKGQYFYSQGTELIDTTLFIPRTQKEQEQKKELLTQSSIPNLERWFLRNIQVGNRNQMLLRYGLALMDMGTDAVEAGEKVMAFNNQLPDPLDPKEITKTINSTLIKKEVV